MKILRFDFNFIKGQSQATNMTIEKMLVTMNPIDIARLTALDAIAKKRKTRGKYCKIEIVQGIMLNADSGIFFMWYV